MSLKKEALAYHKGRRPGKLEVIASKPCASQKDLSLAYTPGVAEPCRAIVDDPDAAFEYTGRGNLVAVITNGTAVLGLGRIGPLAGKPVMEGKAVLFKRFADIDVFDLEIDTTDPDRFIETVRLLEPTFGGINLEDLAAPDCFRIEQSLAGSMSIPVFHDDQHGTAIITAAALLNALELQRKNLVEVSIVVNGAGAAGIACSRLLLALGVRPEQIVMCDSTGVVHRGRDRNMNPYKEEFATDGKARTLAEALVGADVFIGVSAAGIVSPDMVRSMAPAPILFAMANPDPEITYTEARTARPDAIVATGRSDWPNQVNNVLGFPFIFRGALDVRARSIDTGMKLAAVRALADLAKEAVPDSVARAYGNGHFRFGPEYIIPKPFDPRVLVWEASAVAAAAIDSGSARLVIEIGAYRESLEARLGAAREAMRVIVHRARQHPGSIVFPEGTHPRILRAVSEIVQQRIARPILLGPLDAVREVALREEVPLEGVRIVDPACSDLRARFADELYTLRQRKGMTREDARQAVQDPFVFGALMVHMEDADGLVAGVSLHYPDAIRPMLQIIGRRKDAGRVIGVYLITVRQRSFVVADATVTVEPDAEALAEIAILAAEVAVRFQIPPRIAMLSFSNFGSVAHPAARRVAEAVQLIRARAPHLVVEGEMQADTAVAPDIAAEHFPFSAIQGDATVLVFPDLNSSNIGYKLLLRLAAGEMIGPILVGMRKPVHVLHQASEVADIVNLTALAVADARDDAGSLPRGAGPESEVVSRREHATPR